MILSVGKVDNIFFHMNLVSQLAALVCQPGVHRNKERRKQLIGRNLVISLYDILLDDIYLKNGSKFFTIYSLPKIDNISFHLNLVSQLTALVCQLSVHRNIKKKSGDLATFWQKLPGHDMTILDVIYLQNGSKFFHDTFCRQSRQYFLSYEPSQPIGRAGLSAWRS